MASDTPPVSTRPPYLWALITGLIVLAIYVVTLAPTTAFWDTSEYIAAAKVLGIPHPPGNPLFTLLAHVFGLLPVAAGYAARINIFAAVTSAAAAGLWFLVADRWMRGIVPMRWARHGAAFAGVLVGAMSWTVWNQSTVNEKVYTVSLFSIALVMWLAVHWGDDAPGPHRDRWVVLIAYVLALTSTNHMMGVLAAPAVAVYVLWTDWRVLIRPWVIISVLLAVLIGISLNYIYMPMRAGQFPAINEGEPIGFFSQALSDVLNRVQYGKPTVFDRQASYAGQFGNYWQYWSWQFARDWGVMGRIATAVFTVTGLAGLVALWRSDKRAALAATAFFFTLIFMLVFYLNFKYGFSMYLDQPELQREVRERDYFFVGSFSAFGLLVALGLGGTMRLIADAFESRGTPTMRWAFASPVLALALVPLLGNRVTASRAHETMARDFAVDLLESVEPYGILITAGDNDTFPLWYAQEVEGVRQDVTLANLSLMNTTWHLKQLYRRKTPTFDPAKAIPLWRTGTWSKPADPVFPFPPAQVDSLPEYAPVKEGSGLVVDGVTIRFGDPYLQLQDLATIALIKQNLGKRPIYFSLSDGSYPDAKLGLGQYLVTQGFVRKLTTAPVTASDSIVRSDILGYVDLPHSKALLWDGYHWESATRNRPRGWVDAPSGSILQLYAIVYGGMSQVFREHGDSTSGARAEAVARTVQTEVQPKP